MFVLFATSMLERARAPGLEQRMEVNAEPPLAYWIGGAAARSPSRRGDWKVTATRFRRFVPTLAQMGMNASLSVNLCAATRCGIEVNSGPNIPGQAGSGKHSRKRPDQPDQRERGKQEGHQ